MNRETIAVAMGCALLLAACGGGSPARPTPPPPPPAPTLFSLTGTVNAEAPARPIAGARVEITGSLDAGRTATTGADGRYAFSGLRPGPLSLSVSADGFEPQTRSLTLAADLVTDFSLRSPGGPPVRVLTGSVIDGVTESSIAGATLDIDGFGAVTTGADGTFRIEATDVEQFRPVTIRSASTVQRQTHLRVPGPEARLTLIPATFDLGAFDQMFRAVGSLFRWIDAPRLTIQTRVLQFTNVTDTSYTATDTTLTDDEVNQLIADMTFGLPPLTGDRFRSFAAAQRETATAGSLVPVRRTGEIVVARYAGLTAATNFWGYGRWASSAPGAVVAGIVMLDRDFEQSGSQFRRSLRIHELGHSLGYNHVTTRTSVMNPSATVEPNDFDRSAAKLAFLRPPANRSPDTDPDEFSSNLRWDGMVIWRGSR
jgi:hypothetical protein